MSMIRPRSSLGYGSGSALDPLDRFFQDIDNWMTPFSSRRTFGGLQEQGWLPAVDISQKNGEYIVRAEIPGVKPEDLNVDVSNRQIEISGESQQEFEDQNEQVRYREIRRGKFYRQIDLPEEIDSQDVSCDFQDGILELHLPKSEQSQKRRIPVSGQSQQKDRRNQQTGQQRRQPSQYGREEHPYGPNQQQQQEQQQVTPGRKSQQG